MTDLLLPVDNHWRDFIKYCQQAGNYVGPELTPAYLSEREALESKLKVPEYKPVPEEAAAIHFEENETADDVSEESTASSAQQSAEGSYEAEFPSIGAANGHGTASSGSSSSSKKKQKKKQKKKAAQQAAAAAALAASQSSVVVSENLDDDLEPAEVHVGALVEDELEVGEHDDLTDDRLEEANVDDEETFQSDYNGLVDVGFTQQASVASNSALASSQQHLLALLQQQQQQQAPGAQQSQGSALNILSQYLRLQQLQQQTPPPVPQGWTAVYRWRNTFELILLPEGTQPPPFNISDRGNALEIEICKFNLVAAAQKNDDVIYVQLSPAEPGPQTLVFYQPLPAMFMIRIPLNEFDGSLSSIAENQSHVVVRLQRKTQQLWTAMNIRQVADPETKLH